MQADDPRVVRLAAEIADGTPVDWGAVESSDELSGELELVEQLKILERVHEIHVHATPPAFDRAKSTSGRSARDDASMPDVWGNLRLLERIGHGTFGNVYRARDDSLERDVALKLLRPRASLASSIETLPESSVVQEGRLLARVRHPNVVVVHGAERIDGCVGLWMELVGGRTLAVEVKERGPLPTAEIQQTGIHLAQALAAVHAAGVLHRDIKAQNVMREPDGRVVLMDFGTGLQLADDARALAGTPLYLAPEVISGGEATRQSDIYSLGVLLFHLATGEFPVRGRTLGEIRRAHARGERVSIHDAAPQVPRRLRRLIEKAIAPVASERFSSADAVASALTATLPDPRRWWTRAAAAVLLASAAVLLVKAGQSNSRSDDVPFAAGLVEQRVPEDLQARAVMRGPVVGDWIPCAHRGRGNVAVCNLREGSVRPLRVPKEDERAPASRAVLSPDGRWLAYPWMSVPGKGTSVNVISTEGTRDRVLYQATTPIDIRKWTTSGDAVVVREGPGSPSHRVILVPFSGGPPRELLSLASDVESADLAPDERTLVITRLKRNDHDLALIDVATGSEIWTLAEPTNDAQPLFTPDGQGIVFISDRTGCESAFFMPLRDGGSAGAPVLLKDFGRNHPSVVGFGSDASYLLRVSNAFRTAYWSRIDPTGIAVGLGRPLTRLCTEDSKGGDWDPDGSRVAYLSGSFGRTDARIVIGRRDGTVEREIPAPGGLSFNSRVRWSPDGGTLAVISFDSVGRGRPTFRLDLIDLSSGRAREVSSDQEGAAIVDVHWSPSGDAIYYRAAASLKAVRTAGGPAQTVFEAAGGRVIAAGGFDVSPTDGAIAVSTQPAEGDGCTLHIADAAGAVSDRHTFAGECEALAFTRDGRSILMATLARGRADLWKIDRDAGDPVKLSFDADSVWDLAISPAGTELLYSSGNPRPDFVLLKGLNAR
jgi:Tol biopolymer transport system component